MQVDFFLTRILQISLAFCEYASLNSDPEALKNNFLIEIERNDLIRDNKYSKEWHFFKTTSTCFSRARVLSIVIPNNFSWELSLFSYIGGKLFWMRLAFCLDEITIIFVFATLIDMRFKSHQELTFIRSKVRDSITCIEDELWTESVVSSAKISVIECNVASGRSLIKFRNNRGQKWYLTYFCSGNVVTGLQFFYTLHRYSTYKTATFQKVLWGDKNWNILEF